MRLVEKLVDELYALHDMALPMPNGRGTFLPVRDVRIEIRKKMDLLRRVEMRVAT